MATHKQKLLITKTEGETKGVEAFLSLVEGLKDGRFVVDIYRYHKTRSNRQNKFYWGNFIQSEIDCFKEFWGETYDIEQVHNWNKSMFWADEVVNEETGEVFKKPASSTDNTTIEWEERLEKAREWFRIKFEWEIPYPLQQGELNY